MLNSYLRQKDEQWESLCRRCGGCCGSFDDPCKHLKKDSNGLCFCEIYPNRLGTRETVAGEKFNCVNIREIINTSWKNDWLCPYKNYPGKHFQNLNHTIR